MPNAQIGTGAFFKWFETYREKGGDGDGDALADESRAREIRVVKNLIESDALISASVGLAQNDYVPPADPEVEKAKQEQENRRAQVGAVFTFAPAAPECAVLCGSPPDREGSS